VHEIWVRLQHAERAARDPRDAWNIRTVLAAFALAAGLGLRPGEVFGLLTTHVSIASGCLLLPHAKKTTARSDEHHVPVGDPLLRLLEPLIYAEREVGWEPVPLLCEWTRAGGRRLRTARWRKLVADFALLPLDEVPEFRKLRHHHQTQAVELEQDAATNSRGRLGSQRLRSAQVGHGASGGLSPLLPLHTASSFTLPDPVGWTDLHLTAPLQDPVSKPRTGRPRGPKWQVPRQITQGAVTTETPCLDRLRPTSRALWEGEWISRVKGSSAEKLEALVFIDLVGFGDLLVDDPYQAVASVQEEDVLLDLPWPLLILRPGRLRSALPIHLTPAQAMILQALGRRDDQPPFSHLNKTVVGALLKKIAPGGPMTIGDLQSANRVIHLLTPGHNHEQSAYLRGLYSRKVVMPDELLPLFAKTAPIRTKRPLLQTEGLERLGRWLKAPEMPSVTEARLKHGLAKLPSVPPLDPNGWVVDETAIREALLLHMRRSGAKSSYPANYLASLLVEQRAVAARLDGNRLDMNTHLLEGLAPASWRRTSDTAVRALWRLFSNPQGDRPGFRPLPVHMSFIPRPLSPGQLVERALASAAGDDRGWLALILVALSVGRSNAVGNLQRRYLQLLDGRLEIEFPRVKTGHKASVVADLSCYPAEVEPLISEWLDEHQPGDLVGPPNRPKRADALMKRVKRRMQRDVLRQWTPHHMRTAFAFAAHKAGVDRAMISVELDHQRVATATQHYVPLVWEEMAEPLNTLHENYRRRVTNAVVQLVFSVGQRRARDIVHIHGDSPDSLRAALRLGLRRKAS
jgi:integrase